MLQSSPPLDPGLEFKLLCNRLNFNTLYVQEFLCMCVLKTHTSFNSHSFGKRISQVLTTQEGKSSSFKDDLGEQLANLTETK